MKKEDKEILIAKLGEQINEYPHFYLVDVHGLNAEATSNLRRKCFRAGIKMVVVKNTLLQKALEKSEVDYSPLFDSLKGSTAVFFTQVANAPAKLLKEVGKDGVDAKVKALSMYRGVMRPYPHPRSAEAIEGFAAYRGCQAGCNYAEAFEVVLRRL